MCVNQPRAGGLEIDIGIADIGFAFAEGFDLGAMKDQAGLMFLKNMVVIRGRAILRDDLLARLRGLLGLLGRLDHNFPS